MPSGRIIACDPLVAGPAPVYTKSLPRGEYPVQLSVVDFPNVRRVAYAKLVVDPDVVVVDWQMALVPGDNPTKLRCGEVFGYGVDTGVGCFVDAVTYERYLAAVNENYGLRQEFRKIISDSRQSMATWANFGFDEYADGNLIAFSSGVGDGTYPSYFGLSKTGQVACLLTDFYVIPWREITL